MITDDHIPVNEKAKIPTVDAVEQPDIQLATLAAIKNAAIFFLIVFSP